MVSLLATRRIEVEDQSGNIETYSNKGPYVGHSLVNGLVPPLEDCGQDKSPMTLDSLLISGLLLRNFFIS